MSNSLMIVHYNKRQVDLNDRKSSLDERTFASSSTEYQIICETRHLRMYSDGNITGMKTCNHIINDQERRNGAR